ncbi:hypothetical protein BD410DRAFT_780223 [Rickenella mellea]|uniref:PUB domain-containing protein n=1 Tax=Rickenella mellea TaxID=50990 RepID=A0A4R5XF51_9AGAM|nr:hypothetical protein BD410DRAFT_780223 [Rickenella mellea]
MSSSNSPPPSPSAANAALRADLAAAAERRARLNDELDPDTQFGHEREMRQNFRRLLDPGILRPNSTEVAYGSIKTLVLLSENLLREPENPKYLQFKTTNSVIKKNLVDVKGAVEYAVALGFRAEVQNFQPLYVFNKRRMTELRVGTSILKEFFEKETERRKRALVSGAAEKAARESAARNALLAFEDDRKTKALHDKLEKQRLEARAAAAARAATSPEPDPPLSEVPMPGGGVTLTGRVVPATVDSPPPYQDE